jgi:hypothetical protein
MVGSVGHAKQWSAAMLELPQSGNQPVAGKENLERPVNRKGLSGPLPGKTPTVEQYAFLTQSRGNGDLVHIWHGQTIHNLHMPSELL